MRKNITIIAEAGVNHNGSIGLAMDLIDVARAAGADVVKFQTFRPEGVVLRTAAKAEYQKTNTGSNESQIEMISKLHLPESDFVRLQNHANKVGIQFLSTAFDPLSFDFLERELKLDFHKIPSGEVTNGPFLLQVARTQKPVVLSTGMSTLAEVETALGVLAFGLLKTETSPSLRAFRECFDSDAGKRALKDKVTLLHCTTEYPAPFHDSNLKAINTLAEEFGLPVGLSDHSSGIALPIAAVGLGVTIIEKHFTLDKNLPGPDHVASLAPQELNEMVRSIRLVEDAMGSGLKVPAESEIKNIPIARRSLTTALPIKKGEIITAAHLSIRRPGNGVSPMKYWDYLGKPASRDYQADELI